MPVGPTLNDAGSVRLFGVLARAEHDIENMARAALGRPQAEVREWWVDDVAYQIASPTTAGLLRVRGVATDGDAILPWSMFVKVLHSWRHWPGLHTVPAELLDKVSASDWRFEADLYASGFDDTLPERFRLPRLYRLHDLGDDRVAVWMEDVRPSTAPWDLNRFRSAALSLGRMAATSGRDPFMPGRAALAGSWPRLYHQGRIAPIAIPALLRDDLWDDPLMRAAADDALRPDLIELSQRLEPLLAALDELPETEVHGDACPQNLLVPEDEPDSFVVIDWSMAGRAPVGFDLGQLLVGLAHAGELSTPELPTVHDAILDAYVAGLAAEQVVVASEDVRFGFDAALVVRSAFTALPLELLDQPPSDELAGHVAARIELTRYLVDVGLAL